VSFFGNGQKDTFMVDGQSTGPEPSGSSGEVKTGIRNDEWSIYDAQDDYSFIYSVIIRLDFIIA
jgi:hypothetical protein